MISARVWRFKTPDGAEYLDIVGEDVVGSPLTDYDLDDAWALPGIVTVVFSSVNTTTHLATATVTLADAVTGQVYENRVVTNVPINGTVVSNVYPGTRMVLSNSGSFSNGWSFQLWVGIWAGLLRAGNPNAVQWRLISGHDPIPVQSVSVGDPGMLVRLRVYNEGTNARSNCKLVLYPTPLIFDIAGPRAFTEFTPTQDNATAELLGVGGVLKPYHLIFDGDTGDEIGFTIDAWPFGSPVRLNLRDIDAAANVTSAAGALTKGKEYQVRSGTGGLSDKLAGHIFRISADADDTTRTNIVIVGKRHLYLAEDLGGAIPTVWTQESIPLTETGQDEGEVGSGNFSYAFLKLDVSSLASNLQNPFVQRPLVESDNLGVGDFLDTP